MSTELNSVKGKQEFIKDFHKREVGYKDAMLHITSFSGGTERGRCIQLSINESHIQLDNDGVMTLIAELADWL